MVFDEFRVRLPLATAGRARKARVDARSLREAARDGARPM
jgi:hypothetical protein